MISKSMKTFIKSIMPYKKIKKIYKRFNKIGTTDQQWVRVVMDRETDRLIGELSREKYNVLEISGNKWKSKEFKRYENVFYPDFDICNDVKNDKYGIIIAEQVIEHVLAPIDAIKNVYKMLEDGGYFLCTTPFLIKIHEQPHDCYRWTEVGIKRILMAGGFQEKNIITGSWGNRACLIANLNKWAQYRPLVHSLKNESNYPLVVWTLAQK